FHFYPRPLETVPTFAASHAFVGEFGGKAAKSLALGVFGTRDADENPWPELDGKDVGDAEAATFHRLKLLHKKGYPLALIWPSDAEATGPNKFSAAVKAGIKKFNQWTPP